MFRAQDHGVIRVDQAIAFSHQGPDYVASRRSLPGPVRLLATNRLNSDGLQSGGTN